MDQIGVYILPNSGYTFEKRGSEQVDIVARGEKRAYTLLVASSADGDFLPFQQVWSGATNRSVPTDRAPRMEEARERGFDFTFAKSEKNKGSHYSTLKTMKEVSVANKYPLIKANYQHSGSKILPCLIERVSLK
jgi:hypothetical protein